MNIASYISCGRKVYDYFKDAIIVTDPKCNIIYTNESSKKILGFKKEQFQGMALEKISPGVYNLILNPRNRSIINSMQISPQFMSFVDKKNKNISSLTFISGLTDKNELLGYMIILRNPVDSGDQKIKHFKEKFSVLRALNNKNDEFIYVADLKNGRNVFCSDSVEKFLGWKAENFINGSWAFAISKTHPDDIHAVEEYYRKRERWYKHPYKYDHIPFTYKYRMIHKHGHYVNVKVSAMLLERDKNGLPAYTINFGKVFSKEKFILTSRTVKLTSREKQICRLLVNGMSSKIIAENLGLSFHTVNEFRQNIKKKLGASNTAESIRILLDKKLL